MKRRSLRRELTWIFVGVTSAVLLTACAGMLLLIEHAVWAPLDAALEEEAETLAVIEGEEGALELAEAAEEIVAEQAPAPGKFVSVRGG